MKPLICVPLLIVGLLFGQSITPIAAIQYVSDPDTNDASPLVDQIVTVSGVVTAEFWDSYENRYMVIQDTNSAWSGISCYLYDGWDTFDITFDAGVNRTVLVEGDSITLTATVTEYNGLTELSSATALTVHGKAANLPVPIEVSTLDANAEQYEGVLLKVTDVDIVNPDLGYGEWSVTDGSGELVVDNIWDYYYYPKAGDGLATITGTLDYSDGSYKLQPRLARDVVEAGPYTRVQRIQQVLGSALVMLPDNLDLDASYFVGDTVSCIGIVTVPVRELSGWDTTGGVLSGYVRFIWQDPNGGPYSSLLSYFGNPAAFPELFAGDSIIITGSIFEYHGAGMEAQFTEMFITEPVEILGVDAHVPERTTITTGELRRPLTAEQWENSMVRIENAVIIDNNLPNNEFSIDDGSGSIRSDADPTNSMSGYDVYGNYIGGEFVRPPNGTIIASIEGYVYHSYGSFSEETTYQIRAVYPSDIVLGGGPPSITGFTVAESPFGPGDAVSISATIIDGSAVASAVITYRADGGAWTDAAMTTAANDIWTGTIPATGTEGALVEYYLMATDDGLDNQTTPMSISFPQDISQKLFGYFTKTAGTSIADVQYSGFPAGDSYYDGAIVTVTGTVTTLDGAAGSDFVIQSEAIKGYGILCNDLSGYVPNQGDNVTVTGTVDENWEDLSNKYGGNTMIRDILEVVINSTGNSIAPVVVTCTDLAADPEGYEGTLISVGEVTVSTINTYDWTVNDGTGEILVDQDWSDFAADSIMDTWAVDDLIAGITGIWNYSWGSYKAQVRDPADLGFIEPPPELADLEVILSHAFCNPGDTITINVSLANPENAGINAIELGIGFDSTSAQWLSITAVPPALFSQNGWIYEADDQLGALMVAAAGDTALIGSGVLFTSDFAIPQTVMWDTIAALSIVSSFINNGTGFEVSTQDGFIQVVIAGGDIDSSGEVHAIDASLMLQYLSQRLELSPWQLLEADVTGNDTITALDASLILQYLVGLVSQFPSQHGPPAPVAVGDLALDAHVQQQGNEVAVPIHLVGGASVLSGSFSMLYDTLALEFSDVRTTETTAGFLTTFMQEGDKLTIFMAGSSEVEESHPLLEIVFAPIADINPQLEVVLSEALLNENLNWVRGDTAIIDLIVALDVEHSLPTQYALHQNYPNPFNPTSTIRYDLPEASDISLIVYDITGREVTRLVEDNLVPGYHSVIWNGKNSTGWAAPSGLYIARLVTPEYSKSIKMVLLK